jgi:hypothetical protein
LSSKSKPRALFTLSLYSDPITSKNFLSKTRITHKKNPKSSPTAKDHGAKMMTNAGPCASSTANEYPKPITTNRIAAITPQRPRAPTRTLRPLEGGTEYFLQINMPITNESIETMIAGKKKYICKEYYLNILPHWAKWLRNVYSGSFETL